MKRCDFCGKPLLPLLSVKFKLQDGLMCNGCFEAMWLGSVLRGDQAELFNEENPSVCALTCHEVREAFGKRIDIKALKKEKDEARRARFEAEAARIDAKIAELDSLLEQGEITKKEYKLKLERVLSGEEEL